MHAGRHMCQRDAPPDVFGSRAHPLVTLSGLPDPGSGCQGPRSLSRPTIQVLGRAIYGHRLDPYRQAVPHRGFEILRRWARKMARGAFVFTSIVDCQFHARARRPLESPTSPLHRLRRRACLGRRARARAEARRHPSAPGPEATEDGFQVRRTDDATPELGPAVHLANSPGWPREWRKH